MKLHVVLLYVVAILSIAGTTRGNEDGGCPVKEVNEPRKLNDMLKDGLNECFGEVGGLDLDSLKKDMKSEVSLTKLREFCRSEDLVKSCISTLTTRYSACLNDSQENPFVLLEDVLKTAFGFGCLENGGHLSVFMYAVFNLDDNSTSEHNDITDCLTRAQSTEIEGNSMQGFYRQFKVFRKCIMDRMRGKDSAVYSSQIMLSGISKNIRCLHPDDGNLVLCETLDQTPSNGETTCLFTNINDAEKSKLKQFFDFAFQCVIVNINQLDYSNLRNFTTFSEYETFFSSYCQNRPYILNCIKDVSSISKTCQNETNHQVIEIFVDFLESSLESSCKQDGRILATIFIGAIYPGQKSLQYDSMNLCADNWTYDFQINMNTTDSLPSKIMTGYVSTMSLRQCILDVSTDVNSFKTVFGALTNEILAAAKCINPVDGTSVLCESLINSVHN